MTIFNSNVSLPEGTSNLLGLAEFKAHVDQGEHVILTSAAVTSHTIPATSGALKCIKILAVNADHPQ